MITLQTEIPIIAASDVSEPLHRLAAHIKAHPAYARFFETYHAMQDDVKTQSLLAELRARQYQGMDEASYHQLLQEFHARPTVRAYQAAEAELHDVVQAVDAVISQVAGIAFAANARRSCSGG